MGLSPLEQRQLRESADRMDRDPAIPSPAEHDRWADLVASWENWPEHTYDYAAALDACRVLVRRGRDAPDALVALVARWLAEAPLPDWLLLEHYLRTAPAEEGS